MTVAVELLAHAEPVLKAGLTEAVAIGDTVLGGVASLSRDESHPQTGWLAGVKRAFDVTAVTLGLLLVLPLLLLLAMMIKLQDGGPVLFRQDRVGRDGQLFTIFKFRTMVVDAERRLAGLTAHNESAQHLFKMKHDPRITPLGRILRRLSLDELPQLINVLNGSMSLVGPRPHLPAEVARMSPAAQRRSTVAPGITGLWQISGRSDLDEQAAVALDLRYVDRWSLLLDLRILLGTFSAVLTARGAH